MMVSGSPFDQLLIDLKAPDLFGNEAAEDEEEEVFRSYVVNRPETSAFLDESRGLCVARAYKGEGKSALLRLVEARLREKNPDSIIIHRTGIQISPEGHGVSFTAWVRAWKAALFGLLAKEIGAQIGAAWTDDAIALVEEAEQAGSRSKNLLGSILDRLPVSGLAPSDLKQPLGFEKKGAANAEEVVKRWVAAKPPVFLLIDDVDKNFERSKADKARIAAFFDACREALRAMPELRLRVAIRPNVWTVIKLEFESLSHVEQYFFDLSWSEEGSRALLARRIEGYLERTRQLSGVEHRLPTKPDQREKKFIELLFGLPMPWGKTTRPPHVVLYTLSKHRPRWLVELCRCAARRATDSGRRSISHDDILKELEGFGRRRIQDTAAEFRSQCPQIEELITAFNREAEEFSTDELLSLIDRKVLGHMDLKISGVTGKTTARSVGAFLFEIGFIFARRNNADGTYQHFTYSDRPFLLRSRADLDAGMRWEVHPVFRQILEMRDASGRRWEKT